MKFTEQITITLLLFESHLAMLRAYSSLYTQELPLMVLGGPSEMLGIKPGLAVCKLNALPTLLSLRPPQKDICCDFESMKGALESNVFQMVGTWESSVLPHQSRQFHSAMIPKNKGWSHSWIPSLSLQ